MEFYVVLLSCVAIIVTSHTILSTDLCPCSLDSSTLTADCSCPRCLGISPEKMLQRIPDSPCVPDRTRRLDLSSNNITYQPGQFQRFTELTYLDLSRNQRFTPRNDSFSGLTHLQVLYLNYTDLFRFQTSLFTEPTNLETLSLRGTYKWPLHDALFANLRNLTYLDLSSNSLTDIGNTPFTSLSNLQSLDLHGNSGIMLNNQTFTWLTNLKRLDLSYCRLSSLPDALFTDLHNLTYLDLQWNNGIMLNNPTFTGLTNLERLDLSYCHLSSLPDALFSDLHNLTYLGLSWNSLTDIGNTPFTSLSNLQSLDLQGNSGTMLNNQTFTGLTNLERLDLSYCRLSSLHDALFTDLHNLSYLDLSSNSLTDIGNNPFTSLSKLLHLDLRENDLKELPTDIFSSQHQLQYLSLASNSLPGASFDITSMRSLTTLNLSDNSIQYISTPTTNQIKIIAKHSNLTVYIAKNPLLCNCDHIDFVSFLRQTRAVDLLGELKCKFENGTHVSLSQVTEIYQYLTVRCGKLICDCDRDAFDAWIHDTHIAFEKHDFTCKYPNGTKVNLRANPELLDIIEQKCIKTFVLIGCVTGFAFLNLALGFAAYVWFSRWRFRYLLTMGRRNINPYHPLEECHIDLEYDVYISYERDSELADNKYYCAWICDTENLPWTSTTWLQSFDKGRIWPWNGTLQCNIPSFATL